MSAIKLFFTLLLILLGFALSIIGNNSSMNLSNIPDEFIDDFKLLNADLSQQKHQQSLTRLDNLLKYEQRLNQQTLLWIYNTQADIYTEINHLHFAVDALKKAKHIASDKTKYIKKVAHLVSQLQRTQTERTLNQSYKDLRQSGIAQMLRNKVTIAYFYIDDNRWSKWSNKARLKNSHNINQVTAWYKQQAKRYNINDLTFKTRYFFLRSPKGIGKEWVKERDFFEYTSGLLAQQLGYSSIHSFIDSMRRKDPDTQVAIVFHNNAKSRSFAATCPKNTNCKLEYVMLTEQVNSSATSWATTQTQSHEILHLFGAADLYNIEGAKNYAVTDVMNYYSKELKYATISPLTAWSIGWDELPTTPFTVNVKKD